MANDANSLTLADYALQSNSPLVQKISYSLLMNGMALQYIPLRPYKSLVANGVRFLGQGLGAVAFRKINNPPVVTKSTPTPYQESAFILSNNIAVDTMLLDDVNAIQNPFVVQLNAYLKAVSYKFNDVFINNNPLTGDVDAPAGLRYRLDNPNDYQIPSEMKISAAATDISAGLNGPAFTEYVQQALDFMGAPDGDNVVIFCNDTLRRKWNRAMQASSGSGGFGITKDQFDRGVQTYKNAKVVDIGRKADQTTRIITATEDTAGADGTSTYSSMYLAKFGDEDFGGWQFKSLEDAVTGPYLLTSSGTQQQMTIDWAFGFWQESVRSIARVFDIKVA